MPAAAQARASSRFSMWTIVIWRLPLLARMSATVGRERFMDDDVYAHAGHAAPRCPRRHGVSAESARYAGIWPWTQTGMCIGIRFQAQIQSIAGTLTRTQPCEAG